MWVGLLFSNIPIYGFLFVWPGLPPLAFIIAGIAMLFGVSLLANWQAIRLPLPLLSASLLYAGLCLGYYIIGRGGDPVVLRERLLGLIILGAVSVALALSSDALRATRRLLVCVVIVGVVLNAWDITHPFTFVPFGSEFATVGRAAGLYVNPNQAGAALIVGFLLTVSEVPSSRRWIYLAIVATGVLLTFSRGAMLGLFGIVLALSLLTSLLTWRDAGKAGVVLVTLSVVAWIFVRDVIETEFQIDPDMVLDRVLWILDPANRTDFSEADRANLAAHGLEQFFGSPIVGNGLGSTQFWQYYSSTHNLYLALASDFGIIGFVILPFLVYASVHRSISKSTAAPVLALFILYWGLLSHNVLSEPYLLIGIAIMAAEGVISASAAERTGHCVVT